MHVRQCGVASSGYEFFAANVYPLDEMAKNGYTTE
jgi:hypothetical protein